MSLPALVSRRVAILATLGLLFGAADTEAATCVQKCKKKNTSAQRNRCKAQCKKKDRQKTRQAIGWPRNAQVSGFGKQVSTSFPLATGRYLATAYATATSSTGGLFFGDLYGPNGFYDIVFIENPEYPGNYQYQEVVELPYDGNYFWHIDEAESQWTIAMNPI